MFVSSYGESEDRSITFAHFSDSDNSGLPTLKVIGWDSQDTPLHIDRCINELENLRFDESLLPDQWRQKWSRAFTLEHREVVTTSKVLASKLAKLATRIRNRVNIVLAVETEKGPMRKLYKAFQETLVHDLSEDDFADMYAQTITYGLFTTKKSRPAGLIVENLVEMVPRTNPFLRELLSTFITVGGRTGKIDFDELGIDDVVQTLRDTDMDAVLRDFGDSKPEEDPVIHFYEDFLKQYDAKKKVKRGVFYTPKPIVFFIVRSVHEILQKEFGLEDGLADTNTWGEMAKRNKNIKIPKGVSENEPFVQILDPAVGTGTFLVEVIDVIRKTMYKKWEKQGHLPLEFGKLWNEYVPRHLLPRLYGFELMMAPYAIAHMKIGLKLFGTGYQFGADERARIYLTNSLDPPQDFSDHFEFDAPALAHEAKSVNIVKHKKRFTVVIGNPPYAGNSANISKDADGKLTFIGELLRSYYGYDGKSLNEKNPKMLQDDYVKFIRYAQHQINRCQYGLLGYITNHGYIDNPTFRGMRQSLMGTFNFIHIIDLHGNKNKDEKSPDGGPDDNVFEIKQGVAIALAVKFGKLRNMTHSDFYGSRTKKYKWLVDNSVFSRSSVALTPLAPFSLFVPNDQSQFSEYNSYPCLTDIFLKYTTALDTARDAITIQSSKADIWAIISDITSLSEERFRAKYFSIQDSSDWSLIRAKQDILNSGPDERLITSVLYRPFDMRYTYFTGRSNGFHSRPRGAIMASLLKKNLALITVRRIPPLVSPGYFFVTNSIVSNGAIRSDNQSKDVVFPIRTLIDENIFSNVSNLIPNFDSKFIRQLSNLSGAITEVDTLHYIYAVFYSPQYRQRYAGFLKTDFPRVPLTSSIELFRSLSKLGGELVSLHLMESDKLTQTDRF